MLPSLFTDYVEQSRREASNRPSTRNSQRKRKGVDESSDFEPAAEGEGEEDLSASDDSQESPKKKAAQDTDTDSGAGGRRSRRLASQKSNPQRSGSELDQDELAEEAEELAELNHATRRKRRKIQQIMYDDQPKLRNRSNKPDYRILRPELAFPVDEDDAAPALTHTPSRNRRGGGGGTYRSLFSTQGPFGGAGGPVPVFGGPEGPGAAGGVDSDSSDDEMNPRPAQGIGGTVGMTPTTTGPKGLFPQTLNADPAQGPTGGTNAFGKVKDKKALADADPLGVDQNVNFDGVGGLENHINQLKEMVALPLLYPEVFTRYHITPPRGVLFHGPPGTGKTLLARALASSVSSQGKKVTFYMRKGADALSKWVGEAERQLRLLFEEARKNQPSIIFFDEIDGKRSSVMMPWNNANSLLKVLRLSDPANRNRFMPPLSLLYLRLWTEWMGEVKSLSSVRQTVRIPSIRLYGGLVVSIGNSTSHCLTKRLAEPLSTFTQKDGNRL